MPNSPLPDLRATFFLPQRLQADPNVTIHGVVLDVPIDDGLDTLAAYADGTARYINHSGRTIIWEVSGTSNPLSPSIEGVLAAGAGIPATSQRVSWNTPEVGDRAGLATILTKSGLLTWPLDDDPISGALLGSGAALMQELIARTGTS
jgi:hypothetical protein